MDLSPARSSVLSLASGLVGLTAPDPAFLQLIAPCEVRAGDLRRAAEMARESDCALVYLGLARAAFGAPEQGLYHDGKAFELIYALAGGSPWKPGGACRIPTFAAPPLLADALIWGENGPAHPAHVDACVETVEEPDPYSSSAPPTLGLGVIAGGQRWTAKEATDGLCEPGQVGRETVKRLERALRWDGHGWVDRDNGRRLLACIGADEMAERYASPL